MKPALTAEALCTLRYIVEDGPMRSAIVSKSVKVELITLNLATVRSEDIDNPYAKLVLAPTEQGMDYVAG